MLCKYDTCTEKLRFSSWSCASVLRVLDLYYKVAMFEPEILDLHYTVATFELEMRKCTSRTRLVLITKLRCSSWSCGSVLRVLDLYYKVAIFELELRKCTSRTRLALQSCDFRAGAAEVYFAY